MTVHSTGLRPLGPTGLEVTGMCLGTSPLASMPALYGYEVAADQAEATLAAVLTGPLNFIDTSNNYGGGTAEQRIGAAFAARADSRTRCAGDQGGRRPGDRRLLRRASTPLGGGEPRTAGPGHLPLMYLHDPEFYLTFAEAMAPGGPVGALVELRDAGVVERLGVAGRPVPLLRELIATGVFDLVLNHNRFTLVDRSAEPLMDDAAGGAWPS